MRWGLLAVGGSVALHAAAVLWLRPQVAPVARGPHRPVELSLVETPAPPSPVVPAVAPRPSAGALASGRRERIAAATPVEVGVVEEEGDRAGSGAARFIEVDRVTTLPVPGGLPAAPPAGLERPARLDIDLTVAASGRVGGVVALGRTSRQLELADWSVAELGRLRFAPATVEGTPVATTIPVTVVLEAPDAGRPRWESAPPGYVLYR